MLVTGIRVSIEIKRQQALLRLATVLLTIKILMWCCRKDGNRLLDRCCTQHYELGKQLCNISNGAVQKWLIMQKDWIAWKLSTGHKFSLEQVMESLKGIAQGHSRESSWKGGLSQTYFLLLNVYDTKNHKLRLEHFANEHTNLTN